MSAVADLERRLEELESQAAFQDELHARLNDVVARQDGELRELRRQVRSLAERLGDLAELAGDGGAPGPADEVPPHY